MKLKFTQPERDLILGHTFAGPDLTNRLRIAEIRGRYLIAKFSTDDLDELIGFIAAEASHTKNKKIQKQLDKLFDRLILVLDFENDE
ncbi:MAG: hypothetical protein JRH15_03055 [Deltaproteobacteria bacterium]|nr:hypothetical protein [Deltaproteobacteria bacterium]